MVNTQAKRRDFGRGLVEGFVNTAFWIGLFAGGYATSRLIVFSALVADVNHDYKAARDAFLFTGALLLVAICLTIVGWLEIIRQDLPPDHPWSMRLFDRRSLHLAATCFGTALGVGSISRFAAVAAHEGGPIRDGVQLEWWSSLFLGLTEALCLAGVIALGAHLARYKLAEPNWRRNPQGHTR